MTISASIEGFQYQITPSQDTIPGVSVKFCDVRAFILQLNGRFCSQCCMQQYSYTNMFSKLMKYLLREVPIDFLKFHALEIKTMAK